MGVIVLATSFVDACDSNCHFLWSTSFRFSPGVFDISNTVRLIVGTRDCKCQTVTVESNGEHMPETTVDVDALYAALDRKRQAHELSWRSLATKLQITPSTFT